MIDPCQACTWADKCENKPLPTGLKRESCPHYELAMRHGIRCCSTCRRYGPDADTTPICHGYQYQKDPWGFCDEWEADT